MNHRQLPQSIDAEKGLLSSILLAPTRILGLCAERRVSAEWFHHPAHQVVFRAAQEMQEERRPIDLISMTQLLEDRNLLVEVGGAAAITELFMFVPTAANAAYYLEILLEKYQLRHAIEVAEEIVAAAYNPGAGADATEIAQAGLLKIAGMSESKCETKAIRDVLARRLDYFENLAVRGNRIEGLPTGISPLDKAIRGLRAGNMIVIAAPTKGGKTALALNIASNAALAGHAVGIFSLEMNEGELADRLIAAHAGVDLSGIGDGGLSATETSRVLSSIDRLSETKIFIRDESAMTPLQFRAAARKLVAQHGIKLLIFDYLQLTEPTSRDGNRERQVAEVSRTIKTTAAELGIPIIVLSQLNDDGRSRESRSIEQDANVFAVIEEQEGGHVLNIKLARDCPKARIPLTFRPEFTRFDERIVGCAQHENVFISVLPRQCH